MFYKFMRQQAMLKFNSVFNSVCHFLKTGNMINHMHHDGMPTKL